MTVTNVLRGRRERAVACWGAMVAMVWMTAAPALAQDGGDSPQAVYAAAQKAAAAKDAKAMVRLVAPSERTMLAFSTDMGVDMMSEMWEGETAKKLKASYTDLKKKYKVPEPPDGDMLEIGPDTSQDEIEKHIQKRADAMYKDVDIVGYVGELMGLVLAMPEMADREILPQDPIADLKVNGDAATGKAGERELRFVREGGRWYLSAEALGG